MRLGEDDLSGLIQLLVFLVIAAIGGILQARRKKPVPTPGGEEGKAAESSEKKSDVDPLDYARRLRRMARAQARPQVQAQAQPLPSLPTAAPAPLKLALPEAEAATREKSVDIPQPLPTLFKRIDPADRLNPAQTAFVLQEVFGTNRSRTFRHGIRGLIHRPRM